MTTALYQLTTLSSLHAGSGEINFDIIDNQVQRDHTTRLPIINSSSLKGAFREHFETLKGDTSNMVKYIFGPSNQSNDSHQTGAYSFFEANLLSRPVRSNVKFYFNATSPAVINTLIETIENFDIAFDPDVLDQLKAFASLCPLHGNPMIFEEISGAVLEEYDAVYEAFDTSGLHGFLGENLALFADSDLAELELPVLARNYLKDGVSKNLWYEEVVPKQSRFYFQIAKPQNLDKQDKNEKLDRFDNIFEKEGSRVQFGANKSIGYGFCRVQKVSL